jgi:TonB family protein
MTSLLIEQKGAAGMIKTWRLSSDQEVMSFGSSKHADIRSPDHSVKGIQGMFEFDADGAWRYVNLDLSSQNKKEAVEIKLTEKTDIKVGHTHLVITPYEPREELFSARKSESFAKESSDTKPFQLFAVYHLEQLLETKILPLKASFSSKYDASNTRVSAQASPQWVRVNVGPIEIAQRTIHLTDQQRLAFVTGDQLWDKGSKKVLLGILGGAALLGLMFLLSPSSKDAAEVAANVIPPDLKEARFVLPKTKKQEVSRPKVQQASPPAAAIAVPKSNPAPANRLSAIKSLSTSRISQLLGKVSSATAKSGNVIVSNGVQAGTGESGAALSGLGKVGSSGKDWGSEGKGSGIAVSTVGKVGGTAGMGTLSAGKTGTAGADFLEDEAEVTGGLDREVIAQYIRSQLGQILYCYERQLSATPELYGKVSIKFTIGPTGAVESQRVGETTLKNANVESCMLQRVAKWKFPAPQGGTRVAVTYPFLFKSTN